MELHLHNLPVHAVVAYHPKHVWNNTKIITYANTKIITCVLQCAC